MMNKHLDRQDTTNTPIFITGATGFIGSYVLRLLLQKGYTQIMALRQPNSQMNLVAPIQDQVTWVNGDIMDVWLLSEAMKAHQKVIHCAALVSYDSRTAKQQHLINVEGTTNIVNACLAAGVEQLVHISSIAALGQEKTNNLDETTEWQRSNRNTNYGISKFQSEMEAWRGRAEGLKVSAVMPGVVLGSGFWDRGTANVFTKVYQGLFGYPIGSTAFVDVRDVAEMILQLLEGDYDGERFICVAEHWSYLELFSKMAAHLNVQPPTRKIPPFLTEIAWRLDWLRKRVLNAEPILTKEVARQTAMTRSFNPKKSIEQLDFQYRPIAQTIEETCVQFLETYPQKQAAHFLPF